MAEKQGVSKGFFFFHWKSHWTVQKSQAPLPSLCTSSFGPPPLYQCAFL